VQLIRPRQGRHDLPRRDGALEVVPQPGIAISRRHQALRLRWGARPEDPVLPFTALVALSRLVLGLHYPSDVLAGALLGAGLAGLVMQW
jgi:hypothetical protein